MRQCFYHWIIVWAHLSVVAQAVALVLAAQLAAPELTALELAVLERTALELTSLQLAAMELAVLLVVNCSEAVGSLLPDLLLWEA